MCQPQVHPFSIEGILSNHRSDYHEKTTIQKSRLHYTDDSSSENKTQAKEYTIQTETSDEESHNNNNVSQDKSKYCIVLGT